MNERLVEIHNQTMYWVADAGDLRISDRIPRGYTEKFAELIIRECADVANKWQTSEHPGLLVKNVILHQFGVEE